MKNKKLTYVLIVMVIIVWGLVIRWIFAATRDSGDYQYPTVKVEKDSISDYSIKKDTTHLLLNYRDPFGFVAEKDTQKKLSIEIIKNTVVKPAINWNFIKYSGYMQNPSSKKLIAIININGKSTSMAEGESEDNVKLLKNRRDSIMVQFSGSTKFIRLNR